MAPFFIRRPQSKMCVRTPWGRFHHGSGGFPVDYQEYIEVDFGQLQTVKAHARDLPSKGRT